MQGAAQPARPHSVHLGTVRATARYPLSSRKPNRLKRNKGRRLPGNGNGALELDALSGQIQDVVFIQFVVSGSQMGVGGGII